MSEFRADAYLAGGLDRWSQMLDRENEEQKNRAREFKALQEYADVTGIAPKDRTTVMDLDALRGMVQGEVFKEQQARQTAATSYEQALADQIRAQNQSTQAMGDFARAFSAAGTPTLSGMREYLGNPAEMTNLPGRLGPMPTLMDQARAGIAAAPGAVANPNFDNMLTGMSRLAGNGNARETIPMELWGVPQPMPGYPGRSVVALGPQAMQMFQNPTTTPIGATQRLEDGTLIWHKGNNDWERVPNPLPPAQIAQTIGSEKTRRGEVERELAEVEAQIAKEPKNKKPGWDWWPGTESYANQRKRLQNELADIDTRIAALSRGQMPPPAGTTPAPATNNLNKAMWDLFQNFQQNKK